MRSDALQAASRFYGSDSIGVTRPTGGKVRSFSDNPVAFSVALPISWLNFSELRNSPLAFAFDQVVAAGWFCATPSAQHSGGPVVRGGPRVHYFRKSSLTGLNMSEDLAAKIAAGCVIRNRVQHPSWYGRNWFEVITKPYQFSSFNPGDPNSAVFGSAADRPWQDSLVATLNCRRRMDRLDPASRNLRGPSSTEEVPATLTREVITST
jgi:hypothetical protein